MKITVYNYKGGVGKTRISLNLALTLNFGIITNDIFSPLQKILDEESILKLGVKQKIPALPKNADIIFDLGGYPDERAITALKTSKCVLIPVIYDFGDIQVTLDFMNEIQKYNKNIAVIANRTEKGEFELIKKAIGKFFKFPIFELKESRSLPNIFTEKKSIHEMIKEGGIKKYHYQKIANQFDEIIKFIQKR